MERGEMLTKDVRILFTGLLRLFQKLASHICVIFFFFLFTSLSQAHAFFGTLSSVLGGEAQHSSFIPFVTHGCTVS